MLRLTYSPGSLPETEQLNNEKKRGDKSALTGAQEGGLLHSRDAEALSAANKRHTAGACGAVVCGGAVGDAPHAPTHDFGTGAPLCGIGRTGIFRLTVRLDRAGTGQLVIAVFRAALHGFVTGAHAVTTGGLCGVRAILGADCHGLISIALIIPAGSGCQHGRVIGGAVAHKANIVEDADRVSLGTEPGGVVSGIARFGVGALRSGAVDIVVIDSVAALVPRAEIEGEMGDSHMGLQARLMSQALRKLTGSISKSHTCMMFINQIRMKIGVMFGSP